MCVCFSPPPKDFFPFKNQNPLYLLQLLMFNCEIFSSFYLTLDAGCTPLKLSTTCRNLTMMMVVEIVLMLVMLVVTMVVQNISSCLRSKQTVNSERQLLFGERWQLNFSLAPQVRLTLKTQNLLLVFLKQNFCWYYPNVEGIFMLIFCSFSGVFAC